MSYRSLWVALAVAMLAACSRQPARPAFQCIAVLRFENLGEDPSVDWMGRAFPEIITGELAGTAGVYAIPSSRLHGLDSVFGPRPVAAPGISAERSQALAAGANRVAYGEYRVRDGKLEAWLTIEDPATRKDVSSVGVSGAAGDIVAVASALAQHISGRIAPYGTRNPEVVKAYATVIESRDPAGADTLQQAISAAPDFGPLYRELAQMKLRQQDRPGALAVLDGALAHGSSLGALEKARVEFDVATLRGDTLARDQALVALAHADPGDPLIWRDLGVTYLNRHQYADAMASFESALRIEPDNVDSLNQLGYAAAYAGDVEKGLGALRRYQQLQPENPNPLDSMGDVNLAAGRLREAEAAYIAAAKKNPEFYAGVDFLKAAVARLMGGDIAGADDVARQYFEFHAKVHDPLVEFRQAEWLWISGRRKAGYQQMERLASSVRPEVAASATAELALWAVMMGNRDAGAALSQKAVSMATPASMLTAVVARLLAQPPASPAEWEARAGRLFPDPAQGTLRNTALAYALLLGKQYQAAALVLEHLYGQGQPATEGVPVMLAWAWLENGRTADAAALLRFNPIFPSSGIDPAAAFYFPRIYDLRGLTADRLGKTAEARDNHALFQKLSGPDPLLWDREQTAR